MSSAIESLDGFITRAQKDRKYAPNTAAGMRAALNMFAASMNEEEKESLDVLSSRLEQIYNEVFRRKSNKMSSDSLRTYYNRVRRLLDDHANYNHDPDKYNKWTPQRRSHAPKTTGKLSKGRSAKTNGPNLHSESQTLVQPSSLGTNDRFEITFENGQRALIILPSRRSGSDVKKLKKLVDFVEATTMVEDDKSEEDRASET